MDEKTLLASLLTVCVSAIVSILAARQTTRTEITKGAVEYIIHQTEILQKAKERLTSECGRIMSSTNDKPDRDIKSRLADGIMNNLAIFHVAESVYQDINHVLPDQVRTQLKNQQIRVISSYNTKALITQGLFTEETEFGKHFEGEWIEDTGELVLALENCAKELQQAIDNELITLNRIVLGKMNIVRSSHPTVSVVHDLA